MDCKLQRGPILAAVGFGMLMASVVVGTVCYYNRKKPRNFNLDCESSFTPNSKHCARCLCNNPVLLKMLLENLERWSGNQNASSGNVDDISKITSRSTTSVKSSILENGGSTFENTTNKDDAEFSIWNENNYDQDYLEKCRDPVFMKAQMQKIEDDYKQKLEMLKTVRDNEIAKKEAQYNQIQAEIFNENYFQ